MNNVENAIDRRMRGLVSKGLILAEIVDRHYTCFDDNRGYHFQPYLIVLNY